MAVFQYARVSTDDQTIQNQQLAAKAAGYAVDYFYADEAVSGTTKANTRTQYFEMLEKMTKGDILVISEISRIGRNTVDVLTNIEKFEAMGVRVCVLSYGNLDLTSDIGKFVITMAAAMAQMELADLKRRTNAGIARTRAQGTKFGPPLTISPAVLRAIIRDREEGLTLDELQTQYGIPRNTIHRNLKKWAGKMGEYEQEWAAREQQYAAKAA
jgi:putative DNA-invertase from lambdoid prophage Rac